ncbi:hypothetical protein [Actinomycetospora sp. NBRC 106375]|uniref:hypothetical protein n=1 Tax=Actinomycetospora sp. NBRC 106375 TaxID=3032207 RepID=UPI002555F076|nr:hypothetical protein [Actinomycetospora sp. NBRC 106375]
MTDLVLGVDASCARCRAVAAAVTEVDVLPLADYRMTAWCAEAGVAGDVPTLIEITPTDGDDRVRARTGPAVGATLLRRLGPRRTLRLAAALRAHGVLGDALGGLLARPGRRSAGPT